MKDFEKSEQFQKKAMSGDLEPLDSVERQISVKNYKNGVIAAGNQGKYERLGAKVKRNRHFKQIDVT